MESIENFEKLQKITKRKRNNSKVSIEKNMMI